MLVIELKQGKKLVLTLGYSHPVEMEDPEGLESTVDGKQDHRIRYQQRKKLASTQLRSETREDLSHTRARESSMLTKLSDVKSVRPVRNK